MLVGNIQYALWAGMVRKEQQIKCFFVLLSEKHCCPLCKSEMRQDGNLRMQASNRRVDLLTLRFHQQTLKLVSSDYYAGIARVLSLNPSSDHEQF